MNEQEQAESAQTVRITSVEQIRREKYRYNLFVDGGQEEPFISVHEDIMIKFRLFKGREIHPDELKEIAEEDTKHRAYALGIQYLGHRPRTHKEMAQYLARKGIDEQAAEQAIVRLTQERLVDDADYATRFAASRLRGQAKGRLLLRQELRMRGIAKETAREATDELDAEEETAVAVRAAIKKWPYIKGEPRERRHKLMNYLLRRGFPGSAVKEAVRQAIQQAEYEDEADMLDN